MHINDNINNIEEIAIRSEIERLRLEHHDLEAAIDALTTIGSIDQLQIGRLKNANSYYAIVSQFLKTN